ncbi:ABC transporter substrate-binding protein [Marinospirillum celere]|uniref:ABC transporter substrate-binding protein n=1 Tax=Marinospirillum celere TaxID=1122252 RepID=UPI0015A6C2D0|nr:ABC transporter substrate-binding protein [Marinospirillum celere]
MPNPQFAGFFLAEELGFYEQAGLTVEFLPYQTETSVHQLLSKGAADFGIDSPDQVLIARGQGDPLLALAAIFRISPIAFASHAELQVKHPHDLEGLRVGTLPDGTATLMDALLAHNGLPLDAIERVPMSYELDAFLEGELDVIPVYTLDEPFLLDQKGVDYQLLLPQNHGVDSYGDTVIATESFAEQHPQRVEAFINASLKGWRFMIEHPDQALELIQPYMHELYQDPEHQHYLMQQAAPLIHSGLGPLGWMETNHWQRLYDALQRQGLIEQPFDARQVFTNQFLDINN